MREGVNRRNIVFFMDCSITSIRHHVEQTMRAMGVAEWWQMKNVHHVERGKKCKMWIVGLMDWRVLWHKKYLNSP